MLVLKLKAGELVEMHESLIRLGAVHDFPIYQPHVTISYDLPLDYDWSMLKPPPMVFIPNRIYFEPLDLNWE